LTREKSREREGGKRGKRGGNEVMEENINEMHCHGLSGRVDI